MTYCQSLNELIIGKCFFIHILANRLSKCYSQEKKKVQIHPTISLNNIEVKRAPHHKHLSILLDEELNYKQYIDTAILKINKSTSVIKKLKHCFPQKSLMTIYKAFLRPLIDYGAIIYDQPQNE